MAIGSATRLKSIAWRQLGLFQLDFATVRAYIRDGTRLAVNHPEVSMRVLALLRNQTKFIAIFVVLAVSVLTAGSTRNAFRPAVRNSAAAQALAAFVRPGLKLSI